MEALIQLLDALRNPFIFLPVLFIYSILVAVVLPTPLEVALLPLMAQPALFGVAAVTIGAGKAAGSWMIFNLGTRADRIIEKTSSKYSPMKRVTDFCVWFVSKTRYVGLFLLLSVPFMSDTVPVYVYSLFNREGSILSSRYFIFTNFLAGVNRALIVLVAVLALGVNLLL